MEDLRLKATGILATIGILIALLMVFFFAPIEKTMGIVQKIFYFKVATAWVAFLAFFVTFILSILYLVKRKENFDLIAATSAEIGLIFTTIVLITGSIWGKFAWGTWWTWSPRLTTTLILWFIYAAYLILRLGSPSERKRVFSAVFGIIGFIDVPIVFMSIRWWRSIHPVVVEAQGFSMTPKMVITLIVSVVALTLLYIHYLLLRYYTNLLASRVDEIQSEIGG